MDSKENIPEGTIRSGTRSRERKKDMDKASKRLKVQVMMERASIDLEIIPDGKLKVGAYGDELCPCW